MPEVVEEGALPPGDYLVVSFDLDTTGRRLMDEVCLIGAFCSNKKGEGEESCYTQYVMPYGNPKPTARQAFGISVVNIGRSRVLKDLNTGNILRTKSEVSALQDFLSWLQQIKGDNSGIILVSHEQERKLLVPMLLQSLEKYNLLTTFSKLVVGFCNSADVIYKLGNKEVVTSLSLRSLCKTVLLSTTLPTQTAVDRCRRVLEIVNRVTAEQKDGDVTNHGAKILPFTSTLETETKNLRKLQRVEVVQKTLRPIFGELLRGGWQARERMLRIRRTFAEAGLDYKALEESGVKGELESQVDKLPLGEKDKEEISEILMQHFKDKTVEEKPEPTIKSE